MPLYEYYCADCRGRFEVLSSYEASQAGTVCTTCQGVNVRKLLSVFARPARSGEGGAFGDFADDGAEYGEPGGSCACGGGGCGCHN